MIGSIPNDRTGPLGPEFRLIEKLKAHLPSISDMPPGAAEALKIGIGDDAAVWELEGGKLGIFTIDTVVEGVHAFTHEPPEAVGARALTAAVSDIAAMGGRPLMALVALQAARSLSEEKIVRIYDGMREEAGAVGVAIVGGDVVDTPGPLALSVAVFGIADGGSVWRRSDARPGEVVAVTGCLGGSRAGVELLEAAGKVPHEEWVIRLMERHMRPRARVKAAGAIAGLGGAGAAIDISDGLSSELWHIALDSSVEVHINSEQIPLHPDLSNHIAWRKEGSEVDFALDSGEEFELLVTMAGDHAALEETDLGGDGPLTVIGEIVEGEPQVILHSGDRQRAVLPGGYSHRQLGEKEGSDR